MNDELNRLLAVLTRHKVPVVGALRPGLPRAEIQKLTRALPFPFPEELYDLYGWRNGIDFDKWINEGISGNIIPGYYFLPLDLAIHELDLTNGIDEYGSAWFPFLSDDENSYNLDCGDIRPSERSVIYYSPQTGATPVIASSLKAFLEYVSICYEEGAFFMDPEERLEEDYDKERAIWSRLNPGQLHWLDDSE